MKKVKYNTEQIYPFPDFLPFRGGVIHAYLSSTEGETVSNYVVDKGRFWCRTCGAIAKRGCSVLPVFGKSGFPPTNFVCTRDRGLLYTVTKRRKAGKF